MTGDFAEHDVVALAVNVPKLDALGIKPGAVGTVVHIYSKTPGGHATAYEVEFTDDTGKTICTASLKPGELDNAWA